MRVCTEKHFCESLTGGEKIYESLYHKSAMRVCTKNFFQNFSDSLTLTDEKPEMGSKFGLQHKAENVEVFQQDFF